MSSPRQSARANGVASTVSIQGRITIANSGEMRRNLLNALRSKPKQLTVDLSAVSFLDSSGIATLFEAVRIARQQGTEFVLTGVQGQPRELFNAAQLTRLFEIAGPEASP
jgi:anti-sigma B factor antagonist